MSKFEVGDKVQMLGVPFVVEVLELALCKEGAVDDRCGEEVFRFKDPGRQGDDWMHSSDFEKV